MIWDCDNIWEQWKRLGFCAGVEEFPHEVDVERLIAETTRIGREESRLFKALLTFLRDYGDVINIHRLNQMFEYADVPVLGAALEIALEHGGSAAYKNVIKKCWGYDEPQLLAVGMEKYELFVESKMKNAKPEYLKWGLYETMVQFYNDAWRERKTVLQDNFNLRIRALIGPNLRAEILVALHSGLKTHIKGIADAVGYAYAPVHLEITELVKNGIVDVEEYGKARVICLAKKVRKYLDSSYV
jgi:hypothetical protein